jgi:hypothetical protein
MAKHRPHGSAWVPETSAHVDMAAPVLVVVEPGAVGDRGGNAYEVAQSLPEPVIDYVRLQISSIRA